ncbi:MAG: hypothetical protein LBU37_04035 [Tannerellaceae bacterium]|jgi:hypothetical protein|nr:hypothetical protein [Tannerellaceae bacterium]
MGEIAGIKYAKDAAGRRRYIRVDLDMHGDNQLLEDFLDLLEIEARKGEPTFPLSDVIGELEIKHGTKFL